MNLSENASTDVLEAEIQRIEAMSLQDLRTLWATRWGAPPRFRSVDLLRRLIAWRLQAELSAAWTRIPKGCSADLLCRNRQVYRQGRGLPENSGVCSITSMSVSTPTPIRVPAMQACRRSHARSPVPAGMVRDFSVCATGRPHRDGRRPAGPLRDLHPQEF